MTHLTERHRSHDVLSVPFTLLNRYIDIDKL